jgi:predicted DNA-binding protein
MTRRKVATTIYITLDQDRQLKLLSQATGMPMAELIRQGIDHVLERYKDRLPTQLGLFAELAPEAEANHGRRS